MSGVPGDEDTSVYYYGHATVYPKPDDDSAQDVEDLRVLKPIKPTCHEKLDMDALRKSIADQWESLKP